MKIKINIWTSLAILLSTKFSISWCDGILYTSDQNGKTQIQTIGSSLNSDLPSVYYSTSSLNNRQKSILATGSAAKIIAAKVERTDEYLKNGVVHQSAISDLKIITDSLNQPIAALHPISSYPGLYITALHALHDSNIFNILPPNYEIIVFQDQHDQYLDVALITPKNNESKIIEMIQQADRNQSVQDVYFNQLNQIDGTSELALSQSYGRIQTENDTYLFLQIDQQNIIGPSSSGAPVYSTNQNNLIATVVCKSQLNNPNQTNVIRAVKISSLKNTKIKKIIDHQIPSPRSLNCERYDGRRGGG